MLKATVSLLALLAAGGPPAMAQKAPAQPFVPAQPTGDNSAPTATVPIAGGRAATFSDLFQGTSLDMTKWSYGYAWAPNGYKAEDMSSWLVTPSTLPADANVYSVNNGVLSIGLINLPKDVSPSQVGGAQYLSGLVRTKQSFTYGFFSVTAQLCDAPGANSAFWLTPADGSWPPELDVEEILGSQPTTLIMTSHTGASNDASPQWRTIPDSSKDFHTYGVEWTPTTLTWYFDGKVQVTLPTPPDMQKPMYVLVDTMSGTSGSWMGAPAGQMNTSMKVAAVQVYPSFAAAQADPTAWQVPPPEASAPQVATAAPLPVPAASMQVAINGPAAAPSSAPQAAGSVQAAQAAVAANVAPVDGAEAPLPIPDTPAPSPAPGPSSVAPAATTQAPEAAPVPAPATAGTTPAATAPTGEDTNQASPHPPHRRAVWTSADAPGATPATGAGQSSAQDVSALRQEVRQLQAMLRRVLSELSNFIGGGSS